MTTAPKPWIEKGPVDRKARPAEIPLCRSPVQRGVENGEQFVQPPPRRGRGSDDGCAEQLRLAQDLGKLRLDQVDVLLLDEIALADRDDTGGHIEQLQNREVFTRLRHRALVGGDHEQGQVDPPSPGEHVLDEPLMAGHVDDADLAAGGQRQPGKAQVDGEAAILLLAESVGVDAGERLHEGALSVIHVTGGADDVHLFGLIIAADPCCLAPAAPFPVSLRAPAGPAADASASGPRPRCAGDGPCR